jgi:hypothetical protein
MSNRRSHSRRPLFRLSILERRDLLTGSEQVVYFCLLWEILRLAKPPEFADATTERDVAGTA